MREGCIQDFFGVCYLPDGTRVPDLCASKYRYMNIVYVYSVVAAVLVIILIWSVVSYTTRRRQASRWTLARRKIAGDFTIRWGLILLSWLRVGYCCF